MLVATLSLGLGWTPPAQAVPPLTGTIVAPAVTPTGAVALYNAMGPVSNGAIAYVFSLPSSADGETYTLTKTTPMAGNVDVWFYTNAGGKIGEVCSGVDNSEDGTLVNSSSQTGVICPGSQTAAWAVVVLFSGANLSFSLTY